MRNQILEILSNLRPEFDFSQNTNFIEEGMLDSFDVISLVTTLDDFFGISISGTDIIPENFESLKNIELLLLKNGVNS